MKKKMTKNNQEEYEKLKKDIEDRLQKWDGIGSGWSEYAVDEVWTLVDRFFLGDKTND